MRRNNRNRWIDRALKEEGNKRKEKNIKRRSKGGRDTGSKDEVQKVEGKEEGLQTRGMDGALTEERSKRKQGNEEERK